MVSVKEGMVAGAGAAARLACEGRGQSVAWTQLYASSQRPSSWSQAPPPSCLDSATSRPGLQTTSPSQHRAQKPVRNNALPSQQDFCLWLTMNPACLSSLKFHPTYIGWAPGSSLCATAGKAASIFLILCGTHPNQE